MSSKRHSEIRGWIRELWKRGHVRVSDHAHARFEEWGLTGDDIWNVLKYGTVFRIDAPMGFPRYHLRGKSMDGDTLVCPVELDDEEDRLIIVTVFRTD